MSKHPARLLSGQIVEQATTWFVELNEGVVSHAEREAFIAWLKTSPEHIRAYLQVTAHWEDAGARSNTSVPSIADLVSLAQQPTIANVVPIGGTLPSKDKASDELPDPQGRSHLSRRYLFAASVAIAMLGAGALYWFEHEGTYTTDIGEQRSIRLDDGSTMELNARSKVRVALREHERDVELITGQALFRVAKDHSRPFIVHSGDTNVLAVGTQFDVNRHRSATTITVVEGRVAVFSTTPATGAGPALIRRPQGETLSSEPLELSHPAPAVKEEHPATDEIFLAAGEQLTVSSISKTASNADVAAVTAWTQKQIVFSSMALADVVDEFNRYNTRQLVIMDAKIANTKISGEFSSTNPDSLLKGLDALNKFTIRETSSRIEISAK